ncbi:uncharacterized protein LOC121265676 [Juglans microcarpa x Juglans regia]|uniref:uncharacterized protein LOC121265676 n=1 Tax=Juglans microcarpa x Juglans regia TaxID=2249226 RepID=UPI001B7DA661|nr:uncharacterized protein LOC121265676 [Juglans microcarpa x Juglans regia]
MSRDSADIDEDHQYTSLKDIILSSPPKNSMINQEGNDFDSSNIAIKNQLVKHAASAYLQSAVVLASISLNMILINEKLTPVTFPQWRAQFEALLIRYDLLNFFTDTFPCPVPDSSNSESSNAACAHWVCQDKLLLDAILAYTSTSVTPLIASSKTSHEAWSTLTHLYAGKSRTRAMQLKEELTLSQRGDRTVIEVLHHMKLLVDELALIDHPISNDDHTLYVLNGLGPTYREIVVPIRTRETSLTFEELHDLLVEHESYFHSLNTTAQSMVVSAHYTQKQGGYFSVNDGSGHRRLPSNKGHESSKRGTNDSSKSYTGYRKYKPKCQLCD